MNKEKGNNMQTIIYYSFPVSGHINPVFMTIKKLVDQDIKVICYSTEQFRKQIEAMGATFADYNKEKEYINLNMNLAPDQMTLLSLSRLLIGFLEERFESLLIEAINIKPDGIGLDFFAIWGKMIASSIRIKSFTTIPQFAVNQKRMKPFPGMAKNIIQILLYGMPEIHRFNLLIKKYDKDYHIGNYKFFDLFVNHTSLNVVYVNKEIQPDIEDFDQTFIFVGPSIRINCDEKFEKIHFPEKYNGKLIYISLGTLYNKNLDFYKKCLKIFTNTSYRVIMSIGNSISLSALGSIPDNIIVKNHVSQINVLKQADVFISHGGMNSVNEALYFGVKLILMPQAVDQYATAKPG
ncbi:MAG TPA: glycosyltransferase [Bacillota bacterium]